MCTVALEMGELKRAEEGYSATDQRFKEEGECIS